MSSSNKIGSSTVFTFQGTSSKLYRETKPRKDRGKLNFVPSSSKTSSISSASPLVGRPYTFLARPRVTISDADLHEKRSALIKDYQKRTEAFAVQDRLAEDEIRKEADKNYKLAIVALNIAAPARVASPATDKTEKRAFVFHTLETNGSHLSEPPMTDSKVAELRAKKERYKASLDKVQNNLKALSAKIVALNKKISAKIADREAQLVMEKQMSTMESTPESEALKLSTHQFTEQLSDDLAILRKDLDKAIAEQKKWNQQLPKAQTLMIQVNTELAAISTPSDEITRHKDATIGLQLEHFKQTSEALLQLRAKQKERDSKCKEELEKALRELQ